MNSAYLVVGITHLTNAMCWAHNKSSVNIGSYHILYMSNALEAVWNGEKQEPYNIVKQLHPNKN